MNNTSLQAIITEYGDKLRCLKSTCWVITLYTPVAGTATLTLDDIELKTFGDTDVIVVRRYDPANKRYFHEICITEMLEKVTMADDSSDMFEPYLIQF